MSIYYKREEDILGGHIKCKKSCADIETQHASVKDRLITGGMGAAGSVLLILSGIMIGGELLESYRMTPLFIIILLFAVSLLSIINSRVAELIIGFSAAVVILYAIIVRDSGVSYICVKGSTNLIYEYIQKWNYYFDTSYSFPQYAYEGTVIFCSAATALFIIILHIAAGIFRRRIIYLLYPISFVIGHLIVGLAPRLDGMLCMLAGVLLVLNVDEEVKTGKRYGVAGYLITASAAIMVIVLSCTVLRKPADMIVSAHDKVRKFQSDIEDKMKYLGKYGDMGTDGMVTNETPQFDGSEVIKVKINAEQYSSKYKKLKYPVSSMYLKGYHSSDYISGRWIYDREKLDRFGDEIGIGGKQLSDSIAQIGKQTYLAQEEDEAVEIEYVEANDEKAYMPYRSRLQTDNAGIDITEDYRFTKGKDVKKINIMREFCPDLSAYGIDYTESDPKYQFALDGMFAMPMDREAFILGKYSEYVYSNYLDVPKSQKTASFIAGEILYENNFPQDKLEKNYIDDYVDYMYLSDISYQISEINKYRNDMALETAKYLGKHASYTLTPEDNGEDDVIEYFLSDSRKGFCVHFASAGVMILRSMGIPARFVTGYVVFPKDFKRGDKDEGFEASVKDYASHAWVEVYMENCGWVPYEMTPAYSLYEDKLPTQLFSEKNPEENSAQGGLPDNTKQSDATPKEDLKTDTFSGIAVAAPIIILAAAALFVTFAAIIKRRRDNNREHILHSNIKKGRYNNAVKIINRKLYLILIKNHTNIKKRIKNDSDFYAVLRDEYPYISDGKWEKYAGIARAAAYSDIQVAKEDAYLCMDLLSEITNKNK